MNKQKALNIFVAILVVVLIVASAYMAILLTRKPLVVFQQVPPAPVPAVVTPVAPPVGKVFENEYMKLTVPADWTLTEATATLQNQVYDKTTGKTTKVGEPKTSKTGAVNITKGKYILYINPQAGQASGVVGGRFAEIAGGAPSADAVITDHPSPPCKDAETTPIFVSHVRDDLYISSTDKVDWCKSPAGNKTVWYFSYVTTTNGGYFNYYKAGEALSYVITMAYNEKDVDKLPVKGSSELATALSEMTDIVKTVQFKQWQKQSR